MTVENWNGSLVSCLSLKSSSGCKKGFVLNIVGFQKGKPFNKKFQNPRGGGFQSGQPDGSETVRENKKPFQNKGGSPGT